MARRFVEIFVHSVWSTWRRRPMLARAIEEPVFRSIVDKCVALGCAPVAVGGTDDHVHLLAKLHPAVAVSRLVGEVKGVSSHLVTHELMHGRPFAWQQGYAAFSVGPADVEAVAGYVRGQKDRHAQGRIEPALEAPDDE